jgi:hypothetical protein
MNDTHFAGTANHIKVKLIASADENDMKKREKFMPDTFKLGTKSSIKYPRLI